VQLDGNESAQGVFFSGALWCGKTKTKRVLLTRTTRRKGERPPTKKTGGAQKEEEID